MRPVILLSLACVLVACRPTATAVVLPTLSPAPTAAYGKLRFDIVDDETGQPVTADITIRRERRDGSLVEDTQFFTGQKIEIEALVYILVEAKGYHDWEISLRIKKASTLSSRIRLKPIAPGATPTPGQQG